MTKTESINADEMYSYVRWFDQEIRPKIFLPKTVADLENLEVLMEEVKSTSHDAKHLYDLWWSAIVMLSSWVNERHYPGRHVEWFVKTKDGRYLGILRLSSELPATTARDNEIGWTHENKFVQSKINHSTQLQAVIPFRSFGVNCLGGKLITQLAQTKEIVSVYDKKYKDKTVLLTVLSLNPRPCQYSSIPDWKFVGDTKGDAEGNNKRPTFFCPLYVNYKDFLCNRITEEQLIPSGNLIDIQTALNRWKPKAIKRFMERMKTGQHLVEEEYFNAIRTKIPHATNWFEF